MGVVVGNSFWFDFEVAFMEWLQRVLGETGVKVVSQFSMFGEELILVLIIGFLFWCYDKKLGEAVATAIMFGLVLTPIIKNVFWRRRPYFDHENIKCYRPVDKNADIYDIAAQGFSFPSNHSTNSICAYTTIALKKKTVGFTVAAIIIPILVGLSRVSVGVHYPTDVLMGWLIGIVFSLLVNFLFNRIPDEKRWLMYLIIVVISCIGLLFCKTSDYFTALGLMIGIFGAFEFEKRFVRFEGTRKPLECVIRLLGGLICYMVINTLLKLPFSKEFLASGTFAAGLVRTFRYLVVSFVAVGLYPMTFKFFGKKENGAAVAK